MKILVFGLTNKAGLAIARNLSKFGCSVGAIYIKDVAARYSGYIDQCYYLGDPERDVASYVDNLLKHLSTHQYDGMIPVHDAALEICRFRRNEISSLVKIAGLNVDEVYKYSIDKHEMLEIGKANGLLIPETLLVDSLETFRNLDLSTYRFPLVAKPVSSAKIINNKLYGFSVKICHNIDELTDFIRENINLVNILIQEFVTGYGIGYDFIAKEGVIQNAYIHRRLNEHNGVSTLRESLSTDHFGLKDKVTRTVKAMNWSGVGMIEFTITPEGKAILMEFNGRFFGSTELSVRSGINLPVLFLEQFILDREIPVNLPVKNVSVRFFHDELILYGSFIFRKKFGKFVRWFFDVIISVFKPGHYFETTIFTDPGFSLAFYRYEIKRWKTKWKSGADKKKIKITALSGEDVKDVEHITFFCRGNICRSPFAEGIAKKLNCGLTFDSSGSISKEQRLSPINAVTVAKEFDVDLDLHRSRCISRADIRETDLYVVMDKSNYYDLVTMEVPEDKIRFLANHELEDPYGKSVDEFRKIYRQIELEIKRIFN